MVAICIITHISTPLKHVLVAPILTDYDRHTRDMNHILVEILDTIFHLQVCIFRLYF